MLQAELSLRLITTLISDIYLNILVGDQVILKTDYGKFYEVTETKVLPDTDTSLFVL